MTKQMAFAVNGRKRVNLEFATDKKLFLSWIMKFVFLKEQQNLKMSFAANLGGPLLAWHYERIQTYTQRAA